MWHIWQAWPVCAANEGTAWAGLLGATANMLKATAGTARRHMNGGKALVGRIVVPLTALFGAFSFA
jgi:L-aminopeptidase/D-esterase-like protein